MNTLNKARSSTIQRCIAEIEDWLVTAPVSCLWTRAAHLVTTWRLCPNHMSEGELAEVLFAIAME